MIRIGTRGSKLALAQAKLVADRLRAGGAEVEVTTITTTGDRGVSIPPDSSATGIFVKELEAALLDGEIDLAVHSLKDMTVLLPTGLRLGAVLDRACPLDALICRQRGIALDDLPSGARVGTSSPRRRAQLLHHRPDLEVLPLRGNVDTRLRKLDAGEFDAIVLAYAGLQRLGTGARPLRQAQGKLYRPRVVRFATCVASRAQLIPPDICLPAPGQGALAGEIRDGDEKVASLVAALDDPATRDCVTAEREFLRALGGGCHAAVGALARIEADMLHLEGVVASAQGEELMRDTERGPRADARRVGEALARKLQERGASALIEAAA